MNVAQSTIFAVVADVYHLQDAVKQPLDPHPADPSQELAYPWRVIHQRLQLLIPLDARGVLEDLRQLSSPRCQPLADDRQWPVEPASVA